MAGGGGLPELARDAMSRGLGEVEIIALRAMLE
jgi:hypothetical protein